MMTERLKEGVVELPGYGVNSRPVTVVCSRILYWNLIDYNGNYGTEIHLDNGASIVVAMWPKDVESLVTEDD